MKVFEILLTAVALSADAMAASVSGGLTAKDVRISKALLMAALFGIFQAAMPLIGYYLLPFLGMIFGEGVIRFVETFSHVIAFVLLAFIGIKMIVDAFRKKEDDPRDPFALKNIFVMALATSIDALAMGIVFRGFAFDFIKFIAAILLIGAVTFFLSFAGVLIGRSINRVLGEKFRVISNAAAGAVLVIIGIKMLFE